MDQVHVVRHKVLVEGRSQRQVARELGISRITVGNTSTEAVPIRREARPRARPVWDEVGRAGGGVAGRLGAVDGRQAAADGHAAARVAGGRGAPRRRDGRQRGGRGVEAAAPRGLRAADVSAGRSRRGRLLRGAGRCRRDPPEGVALPDAADVLGPRLRVDLRAAGSNQLSRRARPRVCALRRRAGARRLRQSARGRRADPRRRRAHADAAVRRARLALPARSRASVGPARATTKAASSRAARPCDSKRSCRFRSAPTLAAINATLLAQMDARLDTSAMRPARRSACASPRSSARVDRSPTPFAPEATTFATVARARWCGSRARTTRCRVAGPGSISSCASAPTHRHDRRPRRHAHRPSAQALRPAVDRLPALPAGARAQAAGGAPGAARICCAISGDPFPAIWDQLHGAHGPREAARLFAKVLGQLETHGAAVVVPALDDGARDRDAAAARPHAGASAPARSRSTRAGRAPRHRRRRVAVPPTTTAGSSGGAA